MNDDDLKSLRQIVKEEVSSALAPVKQQLEDPDTGLRRLSEKVEANTESLVTIEKEIKSYADSYKENKKNIYRLDDRLVTVEDNLGVKPPEELKVPHFAPE